MVSNEPRDRSRTVMDRSGGTETDRKNTWNESDDSDPVGWHTVMDRYGRVVPGA